MVRYINGKYLVERLISEFSRHLEWKGKILSIKDFLNDYNNAGNIPVKLIQCEMTGQKKE